MTPFHRLLRLKSFKDHILSEIKNFEKQKELFELKLLEIDSQMAILRAAHKDKTGVLPSYLRPGFQGKVK